MCVFFLFLSPPRLQRDTSLLYSPDETDTDTHARGVARGVAELAKLLQLDSTMVAGKERRGKGKRCSKQTLMGGSRTALHAPTHLPYRTASHYTSV